MRDRKDESVAQWKVLPLLDRKGHPSEESKTLSRRQRRSARDHLSEKDMESATDKGKAQIRIEESTTSSEEGTTAAGTSRAGVLCSEGTRQPADPSARLLLRDVYPQVERAGGARSLGRMMDGTWRGVQLQWSIQDIVQLILLILPLCEQHAGV